MKFDAVGVEEFVELLFGAFEFPAEVIKVGVVGGEEGEEVVEVGRQ